MVFWRSKSAKPVDTETAKLAVEDGDEDGPGQKRVAKPTTNVVPLVGQKLSDRLADVTPVQSANPASSSRSSASDAADDVRSKDVGDLQKAIFSAKPGRHIIALCDAGRRRRDEIKKLAEVRAQALEAAPDWLYVLDPEQTGRLLAFSVPHGDANRFVRDTTAALEKAAAMFNRLVDGDDHQMSLDLLDEECRHQTDQKLDGIRRRADLQNIALIKSLDGYTLAPMHEGRVVRQDVFLALPDSLRRDVEIKIKELEKDLQTVVDSLPEHELQADAKVTTLIQATAKRAYDANLGVVEKMYAKSRDFAPVFDRLERLFVARATASARRTSGAALVPTFCWAGAGMQASEGSDGAPVVTVRSAAAEDLCGEFGHDAAGLLSLRPGDLTRANGGIVIAEAWRLAADPRGWSVLSSLLDRGALVPRSGPGVAVAAQPIPLSMTVILVADPKSLARLEAIDPGLKDYFSVIARADDVEDAHNRDEAAS